jgi:hypothetical protein
LRLARFTSRADIWITLTPGTLRSRSPKFELGADCNVSAVITLIVAGAFWIVDSILEALTITVSPSVAIFREKEPRSVAAAPTFTPSRVADPKPDMVTVTL